MNPEKLKGFNEGFVSGVLWSLCVLRTHGATAEARELVNSVNMKDLREAADHTGCEQDLDTITWIETCVLDGK